MGIVACVVSLALLPWGDVAEGGRSRRKRFKAGTELTVADLEWPATTRSARAKGATDVFRKAGKGQELGKLAKGTRVAWKRILATSGGCRVYVEIEPRGWVCARDLAASDEEAAPGTDPARIIAKVEAKVHGGVVASGAPAYRTQGAIRRGRATKQLRGWTFLRGATTQITVGGIRYHRTTKGYVPSAKVEVRHASEFAGVDLTAATATAVPFGWVTPVRRGLLVAVRKAPAKGGVLVRELDRRAVVAVLEETAGWVRIGVDEWVKSSELRIARVTDRPRGIKADERWIDINLEQQVLVAYAGDVPVYATMVSTGTGRSTPTGIHRIRKKYTSTTMKSPDDSFGRWNVPEVPFSMRFRKHYAVHGAYWHDSFGRKRSHGCINLSPRDARYVFEFTYPHVPDGWLQAKAATGEGTPIQIRSRKDKTPDWTDYDAEPPVPTRSSRRREALAEAD